MFMREHPMLVRVHPECVWVQAEFLRAHPEFKRVHAQFPRGYPKLQRVDSMFHLAHHLYQGVHPQCHRAHPRLPRGRAQASTCIRILPTVPAWGGAPSIAAGASKSSSRSIQSCCGCACNSSGCFQSASGRIKSPAGASAILAGKSEAILYVEPSLMRSIFRNFRLCSFAWGDQSSQ